MTPPGKTRTVKETLLITCEGDAEITFVRFVKRTYANALGRSVQEINAHGHGGKGVLDTALRRARNNRDYDKVVLILDTDTDWDESDRAKARKARAGKHPVSVIEGEPCLEAWLLKILGVETEGDTEHMKQTFKTHTGVEAHEIKWTEWLDREALNQARERVDQLAALMNHMGIAKQ